MHVYTVRRTFVNTSRAFRPLRRLLALVLVAAVLSTGSTWAAADLADRMQHGLEQAALPDTPSGSPKPACQHGCVGHLVGHLSAAISVAESCEIVPVVFQVGSSLPLPLVFPLPSSFFRPPRDFLG